MFFYFIETVYGFIDKLCPTKYTDCNRYAYNFADTEKPDGNTENSTKTP